MYPKFSQVSLEQLMEEFLVHFNLDGMSLTIPHTSEYRQKAMPFTSTVIPSMGYDVYIDYLNAWEAKTEGSEA